MLVFYENDNFLCTNRYSVTCQAIKPTLKASRGANLFMRPTRCKGLWEKTRKIMFFECTHIHDGKITLESVKIIQWTKCFIDSNKNLIDKLYFPFDLSRFLHVHFSILLFFRSMHALFICITRTHSMYKKISKKKTAVFPPAVSDNRRKIGGKTTVVFNREYFLFFQHFHWSTHHMASLDCEEHSPLTNQRRSRPRINSAIYVSNDSSTFGGFDAGDFLRRYGSQSKLCRKAR